MIAVVAVDTMLTVVSSAFIWYLRFYYHGSTVTPTVIFTPIMYRYCYCSCYYYAVILWISLFTSRATVATLHALPFFLHVLP